MNIKKVFIILICVFASIGCTIQNISDSDIDIPYYYRLTTIVILTDGGTFCK